MEQAQFSQSDKLHRAAALAADGDWAAARAHTADVRQQWERKRFLTAALCSHEPMDQIDGLFAQLEVFSEARSAVSFGSTCVYLACQLDALRQSHSLSLYSFF